jgi:hypothetical protein
MNETRKRRRRARRLPEHRRQRVSCGRGQYNLLCRARMLRSLPKCVRSAGQRSGIIKCLPVGGGLNFGVVVSRAAAAAAQSFSFKTYGAMRVKETACGDEKRCSPFDDLSLKFTNAPDAKSFRPSQVRVSPEIPARNG